MTQDRFISKRLARMFAWIDTNPYRVYGCYNDTLSDEQAQLIITGKFDEFAEDWSEVEFNAAHYTDWSDWESEFATEFGYDSFDEMPERIQDIARDNRFIDCSDLLDTCLSNWRGHVCARLVKRNGDYIEFPHWYNCVADNKRMQDYLKRYCGIDGWKGEATYPSTWLTALGRVDLRAIWKAGKAPSEIYMTEDQFTIGHEPCNGSGTCGTDQYKGRPRWMKAEFFVDGTRGYGIDDIFGLTGHCWSGDMKTR